MYLKKKQIHSNTKFNEYMYSANFQIHNQIHVFVQYMYLSPLVQAKPTSSPLSLPPGDIAYCACVLRIEVRTTLLNRGNVAKNESWPPTGGVGPVGVVIIYGG